MDIDDIRPSSLVERQRQAYEEDVRRYQVLSADFVRRDCPACGSEAGAHFVTKDGFQYLKCPACWCIFMSPGPTEGHVRWLYSEESANYRFWAEEMYPKTRAGRRESLHLPRSLWIQRSISVFAPMTANSRTQNLLEFGAGTGDTLHALAQVEPKLRLLGFEPNPLMWEAWSTSVKLIKDSSHLTAFRGSLSFITAFEVIEHLLSPRDLFSLASILLEPGGLLMISTPNAASLEVQTLKSESSSIDIEHISLMTPSALVSLAQSTNFKVAEIDTPGEFDLELLVGSCALSELLSVPAAQTAAAAKQLGHLQSEIASAGLSGHMKAIFVRP